MEKEIIHPKADGIFVDTEGTLIIDDLLQSVFCHFKGTAGENDYLFTNLL